MQKEGVRKAFTCSTQGRRGKHEAEGKADDWLECGTEDMRFEQAWAKFLEYQKEHNGTSNYNQLESLGRLYILPSIGNRVLANITPMMWQKSVDAANAKGLSKRMCTNIRAAISSFITYARRERWTIERLEKGDIIIPKNAPVGKRNILQPSDLQTLFKQESIVKWGKERRAHYIHAWRFMVVTGMRRGELCGLRTEDIENGVVHIQRSFNEQGEETKGKNDNANRYFLLPSCATSILDDQRSMLRELGFISPWVFPDEYNERTEPKHVYELWRTYRDQHGFKSSIHELRHTFISLVKNDMPEPLLKALVGHSDSMDTFGVYGHEVTGDMQKTAEYIDLTISRIIKKE